MRVLLPAALDSQLIYVLTTELLPKYEKKVHFAGRKL